MTRLTIAHVKREAAKHGGRVERSDWNDESIRYNCVAPVGHRWRADEIHSLVCDIWPGDTAENIAAYHDILVRMERGVETCPCDDCVKAGA